MNGKLVSTSTFGCDSQGNMVEWATYKPDGTVESRNWNIFDERGNVLEWVSEGPGVDVIQTYNPPLQERYMAGSRTANEHAGKSEKHPWYPGMSKEMNSLAGYVECRDRDYWDF